MLRLQRESNSHNISYLHNPQQPDPTDSLHLLGKELADPVRVPTPVVYDK